MSLRQHELRLDVTAAADIGGPAEIAASLFLPDTLGETVELLICIHGGGYHRAYWHPPFADWPGYSYVEHAVAQGFAVLTLDMLGMGASTCPEPESRLSRAKIAAACDAAAQTVVQGLQDGRWASAKRVIRTGIGHSMGGLMVITMQAAHHSFDRLAVLGWANQPLQLGDADASTMASATGQSGYLASPRELMRRLFYLPDVPHELVLLDEAQGSTSPACLGRDSLTPGIVHAESASITCPVLLLHGVIDTTPDLAGEARFFAGAASIETYELADSAHCHNFASSRVIGWCALDDWIRSTGQG